MPLFDFDCPFHGRFELLLKEAPKGKRSCPTCKARSPLMAPLTVMHPDKLWAGHMTEHGYVTSKSQLVRAEKVKGVTHLSNRHEVEGMKKVAADARKEKEEKSRRNLRKAFDDTFAGSGVLDSFGHLRPESIKEDDASEQSLSISAKVN